MNQSPSQKIKNIPVPILPTMVGVLTLSNVYSGMGYPLVRHVLTFIVGCLWILYFFKIIMFPAKVKEEYLDPAQASLYPAFCMAAMILGSYISQYSPVLGKALWLIGLVCHVLLIIIFTIKHFRKNLLTKAFTPTWFVTYNGIASSVVVGEGMGFEGVQKFIAYYSIVIYFILFALMIKRLVTIPLAKNQYYTQAVVISPAGLSLIAYVNAVDSPNHILVYILTGLTLIKTIYIICKLPEFLSMDFTPGYASLTFPMAVASVAIGKASSFVSGQGYSSAGYWLGQIQGLVILFTSMVVIYVLIRFLANLFDTDLKLEKKFPNN